MTRRDGDDLEIVELELTEEDVERPFAPGADDQPPGTAIKRRWFVVAIVLAVWIVVALVARDRGTEPSANAASTTSSSSPATTTTAVPLPRFAPGPLYPGATGRFAIVSDGRLLVVDPETGQVQPVRGLPEGAVSVVERNGDSLLVVVGGDRFLVDARRDDTVPVAATVFPALEPGHWWDVDGARAVDARNITDGNPNPIPAWVTPVAALRAGFLVRNTTLDTLEVWHPGTEPTPFIDNPDVEIFATHPDRVAWHGPCNASSRTRGQLCTIHVTDVETGRTSFIGAPQAGNRITGRFSPDGTALAMYAEYGPQEASVTVADVATGKITLRAPTRSVPSSVFSSEYLQPVSFDWDTDGRALFLVQGRDIAHLAVIRHGEVGARVRVTIPSLQQVLRIGTQFSPRTVALAPAPARATTGIQIAKMLAGPPTRVDVTDVDTGIVRRVDLDEQIPPGATGESRQIVALAGGFVAGNGREAFWVADGAARSLGPGEQLYRGADENEAWIASRAGVGYTTRRVDGTTGVPGEPITVRTLPNGVVRDGFVATVPASFDRAAAIEVWNPSTRRTRRIDVDGPYPNIVATWGDAVAWINYDFCNQVLCPVLVTDVRTGAYIAPASINGESVYNQPGGVLYGRTPDNALAAYDMRTGVQTPVPAAVDAEQEIVVSVGGWVVFNTPEGAPAWRPGLVAPIEIVPPAPGEAVAAR